MQQCRGRYKVFPIIGTALMTVGLALLTRLDVGTSTLTLSLYLHYQPARAQPLDRSKGDQLGHRARLATQR